MAVVIAYIIIGIFGGDLDRGQALYEQGAYQEAIQYFEKVINSNDYIPPMKATAYWYQHLAYSELKDLDRAADSLFLFKENTLEYIEWLKGRSKENYGFIWIDKAGIKDKLTYAEVMLEIYWMKKNGYTCRTEQTACNIPSRGVIGWFLVKAPFCKDGLVSHIKLSGTTPIIANVECPNGSTEKYYFVENNGKL